MSIESQKQSLRRTTLGAKRDALSPRRLRVCAAGALRVDARHKAGGCEQSVLDTPEGMIPSCMRRDGGLRRRDVDIWDMNIDKVTMNTMHNITWDRSQLQIGTQDKASSYPDRCMKDRERMWDSMVKQRYNQEEIS